MRKLLNRHETHHNQPKEKTKTENRTNYLYHNPEVNRFSGRRNGEASPGIRQPCRSVSRRRDVRVSQGTV